jgi:hypothetical protein
VSIQNRNGLLRSMQQGSTQTQPLQEFVCRRLIAGQY